jgi:hypothetical protein
VVKFYRKATLKFLQDKADLLCRLERPLANCFITSV